MKPIIYVAHPVSGNPLENAMSATKFVEALTELDPTRIYIAPWVAEVLAFDNRKMTDEFYQRVLDDDCDVVSRLDGLIGVGGHWSGGMKQERQAARALGIAIADATRYTTADQMRDDAERVRTRLLGILSDLPKEVQG